jgi:bacterioferritin-associated ferredoxin
MFVCVCEWLTERHSQQEVVMGPKHFYNVNPSIYFNFL